MAAARQSIQGENRRREVDMTLTLSVGSAAQLNIADGEHAVSMSGAVVQTASKPQQAELYAERLKNSGIPRSLHKMHRADESRLLYFGRGVECVAQGMYKRNAQHASCTQHGSGI